MSERLQRWIFKPSPIWRSACLVAVFIAVNTSIYAQSATADDAPKTLSPEDLEYIVQNNVLNFLRLMEDLAEHQIEPMADEMSGFFRELALISHAMKAIDPEEADRRKNLRELNREVAALRSKTRKKVKGILERKQFRKYNALIDKIAPIRRRISGEPFTDQPAGEQSDYELLEYPRQQNLKNK